MGTESVMRLVSVEKLELSNDMGETWIDLTERAGKLEIYFPHARSADFMIDTFLSEELMFTADCFPFIKMRLFIDWEKSDGGSPRRESGGRQCCGRGRKCK